MKRRKKEKEEEEENYFCKKCSKEYNREEDYSWIECDYCSQWFHVKCTDLPVLDALDSSV